MSERPFKAKVKRFAELDENSKLNLKVKIKFFQFFGIKFKSSGKKP